MTRKRLISIGVALLLLLVAGAFCVGFFRLDYALGAQQRFGNLNIDAELTENGNLRITEHWQVQYKDRGTPYWNHSILISKTNASSVQDFTVYDADYGREYARIDGVTAFSATERSCFVLEDNNNWYELGWKFPPLNSGERNFTISYTLTDTVFHYADADELRYAFIPVGNTFPVNRFQLTLRFPNSRGKDAVYAWAHCEEGATLELNDPRILTATADKLTARTMLDVRLLMPPGSVQGGTSFMQDTALLPTALAEEAGGGAGGPVGRYHYLSLLLCLLGALGALATVVVLLVRSERKIRAGLCAEVPLRREMPPCLRPAVMARLYYHEDDTEKGDGGEGYALSATALSLAHKRWLHLKAGPGEDDFTIEVCKQGRSPAEGEESVLLELLRAIGEEKDGPFTLEEIRAYQKNHPARAEKALAAFSDATARRFSRIGWVSPSRFFRCPLGWAALVCLCLLLPVLLGSFAGKWILAGGLLLATLAAGFYAAFRLRLTPRGLADRAAWKGFAKYLREYSLLCERPLEEISLWGDYLVYASAFGLAKTVAAEMALVHTRLLEESAALPPDALPLALPFAAYFGTEETAAPSGSGFLWPCTPYISRLARTLREWRPLPGNRHLTARLRRCWAKFRRRFGLR